MSEMNLPSYDLLIPKGGLEIYPDVHYYNAEDVDPAFRRYTSDFFHTIDDMYVELRKRGYAIWKGNGHDTVYYIYVRIGDKWIGVLSAVEKLDNPHGYGNPFDFHYLKQIFPEFRHTKYSRWASSDLMHMLFKSKAVRRLYSYMPARKSESNFFMDRAVDGLPCMSVRYPSDGPLQQKYIKVVRDFETEYGLYVLVEMNGEDYNRMNLKSYIGAPGRDPKLVDRWIKEMDAAAEKVRETIKHRYE